MLNESVIRLVRSMEYILDKRPTISVVVPVYCAQSYLEESHDRMTRFLTGFSSVWEIIYVDDFSTDSSWEYLKRFSSERENCKCIRLKDNVGQQMATFCGLHHTSYDYVVTIDDDGQYCPDHIADIYGELTLRSLDCVYGIPIIRSRNLIRRLGTFITDRSLTRITGKQKQVKVSSFRILRGAFVAQILTCESETIYLSVEILTRSTLIGNHPITLCHEERASRYTFRRLMRAYLSVHRHKPSQSSKKPRYTIEKSMNIDKEIV